MDDADAMRQRVIDAVNECEDIELLDLIYRILGAEARNGGENSPAAFLLPRQSPRNFYLPSFTSPSAVSVC